MCPSPLFQVKSWRERWTKNDVKPKQEMLRKGGYEMLRNASAGNRLSAPRRDKEDPAHTVSTVTFQPFATSNFPATIDASLRNKWRGTQFLYQFSYRLLLFLPIGNCQLSADLKDPLMFLEISVGQLPATDFKWMALVSFISILRLFNVTLRRPVLGISPQDFCLYYSIRIFNTCLYWVFFIVACKLSSYGRSSG